MFSFSLSRLVALCSVLAVLSYAAPNPSTSTLRLKGGLRATSDAAKANDVSSREAPPTVLNDTSVKLDKTARDILSRATPSAPHFVLYGNRFVAGDTGPPPASAIQGYNVFALGYLLTSGPFDKAAEWTTLTDAQRDTVKAQYGSAGIKLIVSAFGPTDNPTAADPVSLANTMAAFVKQYKLDGIDVDYEDFHAFDAGNGSAESWLITFTQQLRSQLPQGQFILTHAPVAPWFSPNIWGGGGYLKVHQIVGSLIDWYNLQFYNQGTSEYTNCDGLLQRSSSVWPQSAVFQIAANGVDLDKLVIGKPASPTGATNGFMDRSTLSGCVQQAHQKGWNSGVQVWQYPDADAAWIQTVRSPAFPE